jgi:hypothetical protein
MDAEIALPVVAGAVLVLLIVAGTVVMVLRPSDTTERRP